MQGFLFRNRWVTLAWALAIALGAIVIVPRLQNVASAGHRAPSQDATAGAQSEFDRWVSEDKAGTVADSEPHTVRQTIITRTADGDAVVAVREVPAAEAQASGQDGAGNIGADEPGGQPDE